MPILRIHRRLTDRFGPGRLRRRLTRTIHRAAHPRFARPMPPWMRELRVLLGLDEPEYLRRYFGR